MGLVVMSLLGCVDCELAGCEGMTASMIIAWVLMGFSYNFLLFALCMVSHWWGEPRTDSQINQNVT